MGQLPITKIMSEGHPHSIGAPGPRYRLYLDESGDHVYRDERAMAQLAHRFLALCGCFFQADHYVAFHDEWERMKRRHFPHSPDEPILLHRKDIIDRKGPFKSLREPDADRAFGEDLLRVVAEARFAMVMVIVDKALLRSLYPIPLNPYTEGFGVLLQRYCGFLNHANRRGDVMAESRGRKEDELVKNVYRDTYARGDLQHKAEFYQRVLTTKELKLERKPPNISGLQLADILANPLRQAILADRGLCQTEVSSFGRRLATAVEAKFCRDPYTGSVEGYGKLFVPK
ncbi:MAG: DUF3800 domain-containing protein [Planctomycetes bacterium]|nr:DUF3800 domain-containing protein [Planctomycetota bacterium]